MKKLREIENEYWLAYLETIPPPDRPFDPFVEASYAGNMNSTDALLRLYLIGEKTAGSSILEDYLSAGDPPPNVGNYWIVLNSKDEPSCILRTETIAFNKFKDVPIEIAVAEGEGDLSLDYWRRAHNKFFSPFLLQWGISDVIEATVVTEFFKIVHR